MVRRFLAFILLFLVAACATIEPDPITLHGANAPDVIRFEVDWIEGTDIDPGLFEHFARRVGRLFEGRKVVLDLDQEIPASKAQEYWTASELISIEERYRSPQATFWILMAKGLLEEYPDRVGGAWSTSAFALFPDAQIHIYPSQVLVHELGHCLGLVGHRLRMQRPHQHADGTSHCQNLCVMRPQVGYPFLCDDCLEDLRAGDVIPALALRSLDADTCCAGVR